MGKRGVREKLLVAGDGNGGEKEGLKGGNHGEVEKGLVKVSEVDGENVEGRETVAQDDTHVADGRLDFEVELGKKRILEGLCADDRLAGKLKGSEHAERSENGRVNDTVDDARCRRVVEELAVSQVKDAQRAVEGRKNV